MPQGLRFEKEVMFAMPSSQNRKFLDRPQVNRRLDYIFSYPLTVVQAPMGFGKTTALREFIRARRLSPIFLSLLGAGGSLAYCWDRLTSQIRKSAPALGNQLIGLGFPTDAPQAAKIVDLLTDAAFPKPVLVVIDDYHLIDCPQAADLISLIAGENIPNLHLVLLAREIRRLPAAELAQKGLCWMVTQEDLQFQPQEVSAYFEMLGSPVSVQDAGRIAQHTGGWISGIYLIARGMRRGGSISVQDQSIEQLLETNLYSTYDEKTRLFLERLSFLDAFTPEQLVFVFNDKSAASFLYTLTRGNAFISYSRSVSGFQMTDLLREFLQQKARQDGLDPTELYRRMGQWFLNCGKRIPAYDYLYRAGDLETILQILNQEDYIDVQFAQFPQIHMIFEGLPDETTFRYPLAALQHIRVKALTGGQPERQDLQELLGRMERYFLTADLPQDRRDRILGEIHNTWILVVFNDARAMVDHAAKAVAFFKGRYSCLISNETEFTFGASSLLYCYYNRAGELGETASFISGNFHVLAQAVKGCGSGSESLILAEYALERGDFEAVAPHAYRAIYQSRLYHQISIEICATFALCRLAVYQGRTAEADRLLSQLGATVEQENNSVFNTTMAVCAAYLSCCRKQADRVPAWLRENDTGCGAFMYQGLGFHHIVTGFCALLERNYLQLEVFCEAFRQDWELFSSQIGLIFCGIFQACAAFGLGQRREAASFLCRALDIAVQDGIVLPFAEVDAAILPLLALPEIVGRYPPEYLHRLTSCCRQHRSGSENSEPLQLTEREQEVLRLLSLGKRHEEIALALYVSVPTVRYHIKNIYQKLGVNNKVSALNKAKSLGILE